MPDDNKALIASSEFDPTKFIKGIDDMTAALGRLSAQEDQLRGDLTNINSALSANQKALKSTQDQLASLNKQSNTYQDDLAKLTKQQSDLTQQQQALQGSLKTSRDQLTQVNDTANNYKTALTNLTAVSKQVAADNKGRTLFDVASMNQQIKDITDIGIKYRNVFKGKIDNSELDALEDKLVSTKDQFQQLRDVVDFTQSKLSSLDPNSDAFRDLSQVVEKGKEILDEYGNVEENVGKRGQTMTSQLRAVRDELAKLQAAGQTNTEEFQQLTEEAAHLQDAIDKTGERVRTFANDTRLIQAGVEGLRGLAAGFELVQGASALFGVKNEAAEETVKRLTAVMAIANGLQEVSNLLKKESVVRLVTEELATKAYIATQRILAVTLGSTAAASRGLALAITATGIGALVVGIGLLVTALSAWASESKEAAKAQELLNYQTELGIEFTNLYIQALADAGKQITATHERDQAINEEISRNDRVNLVNRQKNAAELRKVAIKTTQDQLDEANKLVVKERANYDKAADNLKAYAENRVRLSEDEVKAYQKTVENYNKIQTTAFNLENQLEVQNINNVRDRAKERTELRKFDLAVFENYSKQLIDLQKRLNDAQNAQQRQDADQLQKQAADKLKAEQANITRDVQKGALTSSQGKVLKNLLKQINGVELETELKEFTKKSAAAAQAINDELTNLALQSAETRAGLIGDELAREAATIKVNAEKETQALVTAQRDALKGNADALQQGLLSPEQAIFNANRITGIYKKLLDDLAAKTIAAQDALAAKTFQKLQEELQRTFQDKELNLSESTTLEIQKLTLRFLQGKIRYDQYQRELTQITETESIKRINIQIKENEALLAGVQARLKVENDPGRKKELEDQVRSLRQQISDLKRQLGAAETADQQSDTENFKNKVKRIADYAQAVNTVVQAVVNFWQQANEAEQKSLEKSIQLQQTRVDAATKLAERGNAEYLRLEQDRLDQLTLKQENAARRQIAINAVLQTSQALTAFISALAQGIAQGGPLGGLAIAAAVLGAIAAGYAIVNSLQQDQTQTLWEGTKSVERGRSPKGRDTVPAMLTEGEAVLPVDVNRDYHPAVAAIYDRQIPAEELNSFVNNYRVNNRSIPGLDHDRLSDVAGVVVTYDGQLLEATEKQNRMMAEHTDALNRVDKHLTGLGIEVNIDRNGLSFSLLKAIEKFKIDKKS